MVVPCRGATASTRTRSPHDTEPIRLPTPVLIGAKKAGKAIFRPGDPFGLGRRFQVNEATSRYTKTSQRQVRIGGGSNTQASGDAPATTAVREPFMVADETNAVSTSEGIAPPLSGPHELDATEKIIVVGTTATPCDGSEKWRNTAAAERFAGTK